MAWRYNPDDRNMDLHRRENLKFDIFIIFYSLSVSALADVGAVSVT